MPCIYLVPTPTFENTQQFIHTYKTIYYSYEAHTQKMSTVNWIKLIGCNI